MLQPGKILIAEWSGAFVIRLEGDVRLTFCTVLDDYIRRMLATPGFTSVLVDLRQAENIDSTTLGQLAKLAFAVRQKYRLKPVLVSTNPDISRVLDSMAFEQIFDIRNESPRTDDDLETLVEQLPAVLGGEAEVHDRVLEAHRVLMGMSESNHAQFRELVSTLESVRP